MIQLPTDFKEFLQLLNSKKVEYLLVGGYAIGYYGYPRATGDIDIWISIDLQNANKLVALLHEFGFSTPELSPALFLEENRIVRMGVPPLRIELLTSISGVTFAECYSARVIDKIDGVDVNIINLDHLKTNKAASGRFKDLNDLENLS
jgi:predicted nucleotidyltransferase